MTEEMSGSLLFAMYGLPCLDHQVMTKKVKAEHAERLKKAVENKANPSKKLLRHCFQSALSNYRKFCRKNFLEMDFSFDSVAKYWRENHGHEGDCAVRIATVHLAGTDFVRAVIDGKDLPVINLYNFKLQFGDRFFVHRRVLIERAD